VVIVGNIYCVFLVEGHNMNEPDFTGPGFT